MEMPAEGSSSLTVAVRIGELRQQKGLTQEELAAPEFTEGYVSALERGAVRPSFKALEVFARRLGVSVADFVDAFEQPIAEPDMAAIQVDLIYQSNYVKMLLRSGQVQEALILADEMEKSAEPYRYFLPASVLYLNPLLAG